MVIKKLTKKEYEKGLTLLISNTANEFWVNEDEVKEFIDARNKVIDKENKNISYLDRVLELKKSLSIHFSLLDIEDKREDLDYILEYMNKNQTSKKEIDKIKKLDEIELNIISQYLICSDEELEQAYIEDKYDMDIYNETGKLEECEFYIEDNLNTNPGYYSSHIYMLFIMSKRKSYFTKEKLIELGCNLNYEDVFRLFEDYLENEN